jgi:hypothetical protein
VARVFQRVVAQWALSYIIDVFARTRLLLILLLSMLTTTGVGIEVQ